MSEHEWKFGDWGREKSSGLIAGYVLSMAETGSTTWLFKDGSFGYNRECEYLPDCTGFDWKPIEPSTHVWQWGDWGRTKNGTIVRFVSVWDGGEIFRGEHGVVNCLRDVAYLPDCTGFDWKPIEPPEGYRLLHDDERIEPLDEYFHRGSWFITSEECRPFVAERKNESVHAYARKIEPIEPPEGYRILGRQEYVQEGDKYKADRHDKWFDATVFGDTVERLKASSTVAYARKIETIEPPEGYRLLADYEVIAKSDKVWLFRSLGWQDLVENSSLIGRQYQPCATTKFARKIELPEPPEGYRLLVPGEKVRNWDMGLRRNGEWIELLGDGLETDQLPGYTYARKIEPYRPFANANEFKPYRDLWWRYKEESGFRTQPPAPYTDYRHGGKTWQHRFEECEFDDGKPFGVENK